VSNQKAFQVGEIARHWLPLAALATILCALIYLVVQQDLRLSANDPQIQLAEDAAAALASGQSPQALVGAGRTDLAKSLAPYLIIFDESGKVLASSAELAGETPLPPPGVFPDGLKQGELRFTWQPQVGVRSAAVLTHFEGKTPGFVLAGRSLREVEKREDTVLILVGIAWLGGLLTPFCLVVGFNWLANRGKARLQNRENSTRTMV
jgi:hypothetical protein